MCGHSSEERAFEWSGSGRERGSRGLGGGVGSKQHRVKEGAWGTYSEEAGTAGGQGGILGKLSSRPEMRWLQSE